MKTTKIITSAILMTAVFASYMQPTFAISPAMQTAIENAKKVEAEQKLQKKYAPKKAKYAKQLSAIKTQIADLTTQYSSKDKAYLEKGIKRYENTIKKVTTAITNAEKINSNVYRIVYVPVLQELKQIFVDNLAVLNTVKTTKYSTSGGNTSTGTVVTPPKNNTTTPVEVVKDVKEQLKDSKVDLNDGSENRKFEKELIDKWVAPIEANFLAYNNFKFCANFTPELYNEHGFWYYYDSTQLDNSESVDAFWNFVWAKLPKFYEDEVIAKNLIKIQRCVFSMKAMEDAYNVKVTQALVKDVFDKYYGGNFKVWSQPFYKLDEAGRYDFLKNLQKRIGEHQGVTNYGLDYID